MELIVLNKDMFGWCVCEEYEEDQAQWKFKIRVASLEQVKYDGQAM